MTIGMPNDRTDKSLWQAKIMALLQATTSPLFYAMMRLTTPAAVVVGTLYAPAAICQRS
jgi:hypothetical protein